MRPSVGARRCWGGIGGASKSGGGGAFVASVGVGDSGNGGDAAKWKQMLTEAKACKVLKTFNDKTTASHKVKLS